MRSQARTAGAVDTTAIETVGVGAPEVEPA
jgi:putative protein kinase ArgK-like GTPase of G3E family